jgi:formate-dependent nitrite reductase membrane component NrfD
MNETSYHGRPAIQRPEWLWDVPAYFFAGGMASGAYILATVLDILGREEDRPLVRAGRLVALAGMLVSPALLIADLGRPERFLNMLRVFRPRSVMNMGSWAISLFGLFAGLGVFIEIARAVGLALGPLRVLSWLGVVPAVVVGSYTGVLLAATNVPLWAANRLWMGPLFFASAMSSGLAATRLLGGMLGPVYPAARSRLGTAETVALTAELAFTAASGLTLRRLARPLLRGRWARPYLFGCVGLGTLAPLMLARRGGTRGEIAASLLAIGGSALLRVCWTEAGKESADDPHAYFTYTS